MTVAVGKCATQDLNAILCQENTLLLKAVCAGANACEIKQLACDIAKLDCDIGSLYKAASCCNIAGEATYSGAVINDLVELGVNAVCDGVAAPCVAGILGCITADVGCLTGIYV